MVLPIYFVNMDKKELQGSLNNHVQTELSTYYDLKTVKEIEQARDAAIDRLSSENCTEEACVKIMGELLDVEYTFSIEIIDKLYWAPFYYEASVLQMILSAST